MALILISTDPSSRNWCSWWMVGAIHEDEWGWKTEGVTGSSMCEILNTQEEEELTATPNRCNQFWEIITTKVDSFPFVVRV